MITLEANYSKKIGLPEFSSHQFSLTIKSELTDLTQVERESNRLYTLLQGNVDRDIQHVGFLPTKLKNGHVPNGNGHQNGNGHHKPNGTDDWACSPKQKDLILKIVEENKLDKNEIEALAKARFNVPVKTLNKLQASGLIGELLEKYPSKEAGNHRFSNRSNGKATR